MAPPGSYIVLSATGTVGGIPRSKFFQVLCKLFFFGGNTEGKSLMRTHSPAPAQSQQDDKAHTKISENALFDQVPSNETAISILLFFCENSTLT